MKPEAKLGLNRTGLQMSPINAGRLVAEAEQSLPTSTGDDSRILALRREYIAEAGDGLGSVPPPGTLKGAVASGAEMLSGQRPQLLLDKLGERLAFERSGVRLYDAFIPKAEAYADSLPEQALTQVRAFREAELRHALLLRGSIESLGADPTAMTPCADVAGVSGMGLIQVMSDPRTTISQSLQALLSAELIDGASWELLITLAERGGHAEMADAFRDALQEENRHLETVKQWLEQSLLAQAQTGVAGRTAH